MAATFGSLPGTSSVVGYGNSLFDPNGVQQGADGGNSSALNVTAATVIKATPGRLVRFVVVAAGSGGSWTFNDCATTGAAAAANEFFTIAEGSAAAGTIISFSWPCAVGIVVSAVPTGSPQCSISFN